MVRKHVPLAEKQRQRERIRAQKSAKRESDKRFLNVRRQDREETKEKITNMPATCEGLQELNSIILKCRQKPQLSVEYREILPMALEKQEIIKKQLNDEGRTCKTE